jgi:hypothetical protein
LLKLARKCGYGLKGLGSLFICNRCHVSQRGMELLVVVEDLDLLKQTGFYLLPVLIILVVN